MFNLYIVMHFKLLRIVHIRGVASLTVPGGQKFHFPQISKIIPFSSNFPNFRLHFGPAGVGDLPTREGPGYATGSHYCSICCFPWVSLFALVFVPSRGSILMDLIYFVL